MSNILFDIKNHLKSLNIEELFYQAKLNRLESSRSNNKKLILQEFLNHITDGYIDLKESLLLDSKTYQKCIEVGEFKEQEIAIEKLDEFISSRLLGIHYYTNSRYYKSNFIVSKLEKLFISNIHHHSFLDINDVEKIIFEVIKSGYYVQIKKLLNAIDLAYKDRILFIYLNDLQTEKLIPYDKRKGKTELYIHLHQTKRRLEYNKNIEVSNSDLNLQNDFLFNPKKQKKSEYKSKLDIFYMTWIKQISGKDGITDIKSGFSELMRLASSKHSNALQEIIKNAFSIYFQNNSMKNDCLKNLKNLFYFIYENKESGILKEDKYWESEKYYKTYNQYYLSRIKTLLKSVLSDSLP